jgi:hypothetical protein
MKLKTFGVFDYKISEMKLICIMKYLLLLLLLYIIIEIMAQILISELIFFWHFRLKLN